MPRTRFGEQGDVSLSVLVRVLGALFGYRYDEERRRLSRVEEETLFEEYYVVPVDLSKFAGMPSWYDEIVFRATKGKEEAVRREDFRVYLASEMAILRLSGVNDRSVRRALNLMVKSEVVVKRDRETYKAVASRYVVEMGLGRRRIPARAQAYYHVAPYVRKDLKNAIHLLAKLLGIEIE